MGSSASQPISIVQSAWSWWSETAAAVGRLRATRALLASAWQYARDSTPHRRRQRFGDADYDWDHRVNTTSGSIGWRERLLGVLSANRAGIVRRNDREFASTDRSELL